MARELDHLIGDGGTEASASEGRIQYASLLGWLGRLVNVPGQEKLVLTRELRLVMA